MVFSRELFSQESSIVHVRLGSKYASDQAEILHILLIPLPTEKKWDHTRVHDSVILAVFL